MALGNIFDKIERKSLNELTENFVNQSKNFAFYNYLKQEYQKYNVITSKKYDNIKSSLYNNDSFNSKKSIITILFQNGAVLIDLNLLKKKLESYSTNNILLEAFKISKERDELISFGIKFEYLSEFFKDLLKIQISCGISIADGKYYDLIIISSITINCSKTVFHISIMYNRANYLWLAEDNSQIKGMHTFFNDKNRAFKTFETNVIKAEDLIFSIPLDIEMFLFEYSHSEFLECNHELAEKLQKENYNQEKKKNIIFSTKMIHFTRIIESLKKNYWLAAGTLLGWYRHCGIIPFTTDIDVGMYGKEYDPIIESKFKVDTITPLVVKFGMDNDSLGIRLGDNDVTIGISFNYELNSTHMFYPYHSQKKVMGNFITKINSLCSGELFYKKYIIPCNPLKYFNDVYGINGWISPDKKFKTSPYLIFWKKWSNFEWKNAIKFFKNGIFLKEKTEKFINNFI